VRRTGYSGRNAQTAGELDKLRVWMRFMYVGVSEYESRRLSL